MYVKKSRRGKKAKRELSPSQLDDKNMLENWVYMTKSVLSDHKKTLNRISHFTHCDILHDKDQIKSEHQARDEFIQKKQDLKIEENRLILAKMNIEGKHDKQNNMDLIKEEPKNLSINELYQSVNKDEPITQDRWEYHKILENRDMLQNYCNTSTNIVKEPPKNYKEAVDYYLNKPDNIKYCSSYDFERLSRFNL